MAKLYQRQNPLLSRGKIIQPDKQPSIGAAVARFGASALDEIAKDNFALGHANLATSIIQTAYETNPTNLKGFNDMVQSGIEKSTKNLPGDMARKIRADAEKKALAMNAKIRTNMNKVATAELEANVQANIDDITGDGPLGMQSLNIGMMETLIYRDKDGFKQYKDAWDSQHQKLSNLAELRNPLTGAYVIGKESERNMYKQGLVGKVDAFRSAIEKLSKDALIKFDEEVFQDKPAFMKAYGIDNTTYDDLEKVVKNRRKAFDDQDKRVIKDQDYFAASALADINPAVLDDIEKRGTLSKETTSEIRKAYNQARKKGNPDAGFLRNIDQNQGFLAGLAELQDAISTDDGSEDYADNLLKTAAKVSSQISMMRQDGIINEEQAQILQKGLSGVVSDQNFADALDMNDSFLLSEIMRGAYNDFNASVARREEGYKTLSPNKQITPDVAERMKKAARFETGLASGTINSSPRTIKISDLTKKALNEAGANYAAQIIALETIGQHEQAMQLKSDANKELIYLKYRDWIPRQEFARLENALANGKKAYTQIGGSVFQYKGLSQNGVILEGEF